MKQKPISNVAPAKTCARKTYSSPEAKAYAISPRKMILASGETEPEFNGFGTEMPF